MNGNVRKRTPLVLAVSFLPFFSGGYVVRNLARRLPEDRREEI
jgi:hypothetical protein